MSEKKLDARVRYTRMVIRNSFMALMAQKPLAKVTVKEICDGADINRATFYAHYHDPVDLVTSIEAEITEGINQRLAGAFAADGSNLTDILTRVFRYIRENAAVFTVLLSDNGDTGFQAQVVSTIEKQFVSAWTLQRARPKEEAEDLYTFVSMGCVGLIRKWLDDGMKKTEAEMAQLVIRLSYNGYAAF